MKEVRCQSCNRLLGLVKNGIFENKLGQQVIRTAGPVLVRCPKCGLENTVVGRRKK